MFLECLDRFSCAHGSPLVTIVFVHSQQLLGDGGGGGGGGEGEEGQEEEEEEDEEEEEVVE